LNDKPDSSISHTLVIGGSVEAPPPVFVDVGAFVSDSLAGVVVLAGAGLLGALARAVPVAGLARGALAGAGAVFAGGAVLAGVAAGACERSRAASDAISAGSCCTTPPLPASDAVGAGPIAAPTPTPSVSIATASAAPARSDGTRERPLRGASDRSGEGGVCPAESSIAHKATYLDNIYQHYGMFAAPAVTTVRLQPAAVRSRTQKRSNSQMNRIRRLSLAFAVAGVLGVAAPVAASAITTVTISGATASYPLVSLLASKYVKTHPGKVKFKITQGGAQIGINDVAAGRVSIGDVSRDPIASDPAGLVFYPIAKYGICVITNKSNPVANLSASQVTSIFTGKTINWSQVSGATATGPIDLISRTSVAGVLTNFQTLFLEGKKVSTKAAEEPSEGLLRAKVESDPSAIGFVSNYQSDKGTVNAVGYNGVQCNHENVKAGTYAGTARFYEVTKGKATGASSQFIGWIEKSAAAKKIVNTQWLTI
jgi:phosphate transport system substrate-binding protein